MAKEVSKAQCILLAVHYASSANIKALHSFTPTRSDAFEPELVLRILLTYLPESTEPREYTKYVEEVASRLYLDYEREDVELDISPINDLTEEQAQKRVKKLQLLDLNVPDFPPHAPEDLLTRFLCHRSQRIDEETGLLNIIPQLIEPFLNKDREYLRTWYISAILPILRLQFDYYPDEDPPQISLAEFASLEGTEGIDFLLQKGVIHDGAIPIEGHSGTTIARDVRGLVGPWMYGHTERKRRKLDRKRGTSENGDYDGVSEIEDRTRKISLSGVTEDDKTGHDWEYMYAWLVGKATDYFAVVSHCIEDWDGPGDIDFGGFSQGGRDYLDDDIQRKLELQYAQAAFAVCYVVTADTQETIKGAHGLLARLAELLDFIPPPDLASSVESLPKIERHATSLDASRSTEDLSPDSLLKPEHPLTTPRLETYMLLQMMVYSAYQLSGLGHPISLVNVAKLHFYASADEQLAMLKKILNGLTRSGARKDETQWASDRAKLMWLWNWGIDAEDEDAKTGPGVLGKVERQTFEEEMLKCFVDTSCYPMAMKLYLPEGSKGPTALLSREQIEAVVLGKAMEMYDGASNGNRNRGGMKRASDTINAFKPFFSSSLQFRQASALIAATHALSFYSLTLQHGVPFQPVSIRVSSDPVGLMDKVLEQNGRAYTKLDDLTSIGRNLVEAGLPVQQGDEGASTADLERKKQEAERRVTFMAVEAALREDDFETAYSYIVNRLTPSGADIAPSQIEAKTAHARSTSSGSARSQKGKKEAEDDVSWRAAFLAGRYRPSTSSPPTLRRLEQRTELLSLSLLLAPTSQLTDILAVWRRCEEEMTSLQLSQQAAEEDFDDRADKRGSTSALPGNFTIGGEQPEMVLNQKRREMGRMGGGGAGDEGGEAPMSMFDLTRSAARAFSRNAFPLHGGATSGDTQRTSTESQRGIDASVDSLGSAGVGGERVRKRDMVANAVSGGLASGLGWVLGATPASQQEQE